jgi:diguanylate cyclase (GGDEF)-like protein
MVNLMQYDRLTGLYSKEFFYQKAKEILLRHPNKTFDIICSDVESFKLVNDVFGISAGDRLLQKIAEMYTEVVGQRGICGRFNADQFACLVEHTVDYTDEIFSQAGSRISSFSPGKNLMMKWGIYRVNDRTLSVETMCDRALLAAGSIKGQYGKYFAAYDDKLRSRLLREQAITDSMESALAQGQFEIYLQPKYRIKDDRLAGAEALVRWNHPEWGMQSPAEFIPLFEKNGFITKLDQFVWERACEVLEEWDKQGIAPESISVNVSRADIYNADLTDILLSIVKKHGLTPERLHLEITESAYTEDPKQIIDTVNSLREIGFVIEMDDFGSGYSSLNMLNQMSLDILKLDMKFIRSETAKPMNQGILRFIMSLARWMNLSVVAEGVETKEQLERLREIGCDYVQGYYFAKPMPCAEFADRMRAVPKAPEIRSLATESFWEEETLPYLLVADESEEYRKAVVHTFAGRYRVVEATDCETIQDCVIHHRSRIAAVILSLTLPAPGGEPVLELLCREKINWEIPVIATGLADEKLEAMAFEMGADDFAAKPHRQDSLARRVQHVIGNLRSREKVRILEDRAGRDYLTGLLNRRGLTASLEALRKEDEPLAVFLFDLDNLKQVNDEWGHIRGDELILEFAGILKSYTRESDILARFGGDEFLVVMKRMNSPEDAARKGEEICRALRDSQLAGMIPASCTGGIAVCGMADSMKEMIEQADQALYHAKSGNKGKCSLWKNTSCGVRAADLRKEEPDESISGDI